MRRSTQRPDDLDRAILQHLADGYAWSEVPTRLSLSERGGRKRLDTLVDRLYLRDLVQVYILAGQRGWARVPE